VSLRFPKSSEPIVEKNIFRQRGRAKVELKKFEELRPRLPAPFLPQDSGWSNLYWAAWESMWSSLESPGSHAAFPGSNEPLDSPILEMGKTAFLTQVAGYLPGDCRLIDLLDHFYVCQHDDGFIPREIALLSDHTVSQPYEPNSTGPTLLSWAEWRYFRLTGDDSRIENVFWPLMAFHRWCRANRTWQNGLYWTTGYSSGLINQPRVPGGRYHHKHWAWIDASVQAYIDAIILERMARVLDEKTLVDELASEIGLLNHNINASMWNGEQQFYQDTGPDGRFSPVKSIAAYWSLLGERLIPPERLTPFVQHLRDTWSFKLDHCIPSLSADSEGYNSLTGNQWRGAVWPDLTYMVLRGLHNANEPELAHSLAYNHVDAVCRVHESTGRFWENYAPEDLGPGDPSDQDQTGLTGMVVAATMLENILGISLDWPLRQVTWHRQLKRDHDFGVRNLPLGHEGRMDLIVSGESIQIQTDVPFTLIIRNGRDIVQSAVPSGSFTISMD
jgi:hypothetical protein